MCERASGAQPFIAWVRHPAEPPPPAGSQPPLAGTAASCALHSVHVDHESRRLVTAGNDSHVRIWSISCLREKGTHGTAPANALLATIAVDSNNIDVARFANTRSFLCIGDSNGRVTSYAFRPGQGTAAFGSGAGPSLENWKRERQVMAHTHNVLDMAWGKGDAYLATAGVDNVVCVLTGSNLQLVRRLECDGPAKGVAWDPNGNFLTAQVYVAQENKTDTLVPIAFWETKGWKLVTSVSDGFCHGTDTAYMRHTWCPHGDSVLFVNGRDGDSNCFARYVLGQDGKPKRTDTIKGHKKPVTVVRSCPVQFRKAGAADEAKSAIADLWASACTKSQLAVWMSGLAKPTLLTPKKLFRKSVTDMAWSPDGQDLFVVCEGGQLAHWTLADVLGRYVNQYTVASPVGERPVTSDDRGGGTTPDGQAQAPRTDVPALAGLSPAEQPTASGCHPDFQQDKSSAASGKPVERQQNSNGTPGGAGHTNPAENHFQLQRPGKDQQDIYRKALEAIHHRLPTNGNIAGTSTNAVEGNAMTVTQRLGGLSQDPGGHTSLSGASGTAVQLAGLNREEEKRRITPVPLAESTAQPQDPGAGTLEGQHPRRRVHPAPMLATHGIAGSGVGVQQPGQANKDWEKPNRALDLLLVPPEAGSSGDGMQREQQNGEINPEKVKVLRKVIPDPMPPQGTSKGNGATVTPAKADSQADGSAAVVSSRKRVTPIPVEDSQAAPTAPERKRILPEPVDDILASTSAGRPELAQEKLLLDRPAKKSKTPLAGEAKLNTSTENTSMPQKGRIKPNPAAMTKLTKPTSAQVRRIEPLPVGGSHAGPPEPMVRVAGTQPGRDSDTDGVAASQHQAAPGQGPADIETDYLSASSDGGDMEGPHNSKPGLQSNFLIGGSPFLQRLAMQRGGELYGMRVTGKVGVIASWIDEGGKAQLSISPEGDLKLQVGGTTRWQDSWSRPVVRACGSMEFTAIAAAGGILHVYDKDGRRRLPPLKLGTDVISLHAQESICLASTEERVWVWNLKHVSEGRPRLASSAQKFTAGMPSSALAAVKSVRLSSSGVVVVLMDDGEAYAWHQDLDCWALVADGAAACPHSLYAGICHPPGIGPADAWELATVLKESLSARGHPVWAHPRNLGNFASFLQSRAHLERNIAAAKMLALPDQAAEVDAWVAEYQKFVTQHGNLGRELQTA